MQVLDNTRVRYRFGRYVDLDGGCVYGRLARSDGDKWRE